MASQGGGGRSGGSSSVRERNAGASPDVPF
jgi:hypothetical protein